MTDLIESLPAVDEDKPLALWTAPELLHETARRGLMRVLEVVSRPLDEIGDLKEKRLVCEMGLGAAKLLANVQAAQMRHESDKGWDEILARIAEVKAKQAP